MSCSREPVCSAGQVEYAGTVRSGRSTMACRSVLTSSALLLGGALILGAPEPAAAASGNNGQGLTNPRTVFITSGGYSGDMGGLQGADQICQALASTARLKGTYKAWLSDSTPSSPSTRFRKSGGPYKFQQ